KEYYPFSYLEIKGQVGDFGAVMLANVLQTYKGLVSLELDQCGISDIGARALANAAFHQMQHDKDNFLEKIKDLKLSDGLEFKYDLALINSLKSDSEKGQAREALHKVYMLKCFHDLGDSEDWGKYKEYGELSFQDLREKFMNFIKEKLDPNSLRYDFLDNFKSKGQYLQSLCLSSNEINDGSAFI